MAEWIAVLFDHIIEKYGGETTLNEFRVMNQITLTISRVVTRLVERGYLREETDQWDRRRRQIYLTESFLAEVMGHFNKLEVALPEES
jgi:hypothetical protein